ncbi:MAG: hypothetical protein ICV78_26365 [Tolypothrix sp. Co-bin9]|nr:hypothetical protein [Tolypothrix sp. Co-bin9]
MKKFVVSTTMGIAIIAAIFPKTAQAHVGWKHTYYCGNVHGWLAVPEVLRLLACAVSADAGDLRSH